MKQIFSAITVSPPLLGSRASSNGTASSSMSPSSGMSMSTMRVHSSSTAAVARAYGGIAWKASKTWQSWGLHGSVVKTTKGQSTDYDAAFSVRLPLAWWFGSHILKGELAMSFPRLNTLTLRHPSYFAVARVLDYSHPFFQACGDNDVAVVRKMLRSGEGRPTDENPVGDGPLWVCAEWP